MELTFLGRLAVLMMAAIALAFCASTPEACARTVTVIALDAPAHEQLIMRRESGKGDYHVWIWSLVDPRRTPLEARDFLVTDEILGVELRLDRDRILMHSYATKSAFVVDLANGSTTKLLDEGQTKFFKVLDDRVLFVQRLVDEPIGFQLEPRGDTAAVEGEPKAIDVLWSVPRDGSAPPERRMDHAIECVLAYDGTTTYAVTGPHDRRLLEIPLDGPLRDLGPVPEDWVLSMTSCAPSPDSSLLAIGATPRDDFFDVRRLYVLDLDTGVWMIHGDEIHARVSLLSSISPTLAMAWRDERMLRYSESVLDDEGGGVHRYVDLDVESGVKTPHEPYSTKLGIYHTDPEGIAKTSPAPTPSKNDPFRTGSDGYIYWRDGSEPLFDPLDETRRTVRRARMERSPTLRFMVVSDPRLDPASRLYDGGEQTWVALPAGAHPLEWLAPAP